MTRRLHYHNSDKTTETDATSNSLAYETYGSGQKWSLALLGAYVKFADALSSGRQKNGCAYTVCTYVRKKNR